MGLKKSGLRGSLRSTSSVLPAFFDVTITNTNSPVQEGDILTVDYSADNTGDAQDTQDIRLEIDSVEEDRDSDITLLGAQSTTGTLEWDTTGEDETTYTATVLSNDDTDSVTVEIEAAIPDSAIAQFDASELSLDDSDPVTTWSDELGNYDLTDAGGGDPVYRTDELNGLPVVEFDGDRNNADLLDNTSISSNQPNSIIIVCKHDPVDSTGFVYGEAGGNRTGLAGSSDDVWSWRGDSNIEGGTLDANEYTILTGIYDGVSSIGRQDGTEVASGDVGTDALDGISVGGRDDEEFGLNGGIAELRIYDDRLSSSEYESEESNLSEKWGISLD